MSATVSSLLFPAAACSLRPPPRSGLPMFLEWTRLDLEGPGRSGLDGQMVCGVGQVVGGDKEIVRLVFQHGARARQIDHAINNDQGDVDAVRP